MKQLVHTQVHSVRHHNYTTINVIEEEIGIILITLYLLIIIDINKKQDNLA